jgi:hypothetical protein
LIKERLSGHSAPLDEEIIVGEWRLVAAIGVGR